MTVFSEIYIDDLKIQLNEPLGKYPVKNSDEWVEMIVSGSYTDRDMIELIKERDAYLKCWKESVSNNRTPNFTIYEKEDNCEQA